MKPRSPWINHGLDRFQWKDPRSGYSGLSFFCVLFPLHTVSIGRVLRVSVCRDCALRRKDSKANDLLQSLFFFVLLDETAGFVGDIEWSISLEVISHISIGHPQTILLEPKRTHFLADTSRSPAYSSDQVCFLLLVFSIFPVFPDKSKFLTYFIWIPISSTPKKNEALGADNGTCSSPHRTSWNASTCAHTQILVP